MTPEQRKRAERIRKRAQEHKACGYAALGVEMDELDLLFSLIDEQETRILQLTGQVVLAPGFAAGIAEGKRRALDMATAKVLDLAESFAREKS